MTILNSKNVDKKELVNVQSEETNLSELAALDGFTLYGAATFQTADTATGEIREGCLLKTDVGNFVGISRNVYNSIAVLLDTYTTTEIKGGLKSAVYAKDGGGERKFYNFKLL